MASQESSLRNETQPGAEAPHPLQDRLLQMEEVMDRMLREHASLQRLLDGAESASRRHASQLQGLERQVRSLSSQFVAVCRLHEGLDAGAVVVAMREIVISLIGSEELAIFELGPGEEALRLVGWSGIDPARYQRLPLSAGRIGWVARTGRPILPGDDTGAPTLLDERLTACIPLKLGEAVTGAVAVFRLLPHKDGLEALDFDLLSLLSEHGGKALHLARLRQGAGRPTPPRRLRPSGPRPAPPAPPAGP